MNGNNVIYFKRFGDEYIPKQINKIIGDKNVRTNIYRIQAYDLMCVYWIMFCIGFIDFMLKGQSLLYYTIFVSPDEYEKNDKIILKNISFYYLQ